MNWMINHGTLNLTHPHINYVLVETWEDFKLSSTEITQKSFRKIHPPPLSLSNLVTNHQACLAGIIMSNREKLDDIGCIENVSIAPIDMEEVSTTDLMLILRKK